MDSENETPEPQFQFGNIYLGARQLPRRLGAIEERSHTDSAFRNFAARLTGFVNTELRRENTELVEYGPAIEVSTIFIYFASEILVHPFHKMNDLHIIFIDPRMPVRKANLRICRKLGSMHRLLAVFANVLRTAKIRRYHHSYWLTTSGYYLWSTGLLICLQSGEWRHRADCTDMAYGQTSGSTEPPCTKRSPSGPSTAACTATRTMPICFPSVNNPRNNAG